MLRSASASVRSPPNHWLRSLGRAHHLHHKSFVERPALRVSSAYSCRSSRSNSVEYVRRRNDHGIATHGFWNTHTTRYNSTTSKPIQPKTSDRHPNESKNIDHTKTIETNTEVNETATTLGVPNDTETTTSVTDIPDTILKNQTNTASIDVSTLYDKSMHLPYMADFASDEYEPSTPLTDEIIQIISQRGPITVAEYIRLSLTHPLHGYYTHQSSTTKEEDPFDENYDLLDSKNTEASGADQIIGSAGDFTTAPEISQLFGESLLVWYIIQWQTLHNSCRALTWIECGPGKGTLLVDMMRLAMKTFPGFVEAVCEGGIHLVERGRGMRRSQAQALRELMEEAEVQKAGFTLEMKEKDLEDESLELSREELETALNAFSSPRSSVTPKLILDPNVSKRRKRVISVKWHDELTTVPISPEKPQFIVAQELIDALPVHSFQKTEIESTNVNGDITKDQVWRERLVDVDARPMDNDDGTIPTPATSDTSTKTNTKKPRLRFVLAPSVTPALRTLLNTDDAGKPKPNTTHTPTTVPTTPNTDSTPPVDDSSPGDILEICPDGMSLCQDMARRIQISGGAALLIDYGSALTQTHGDTLRAFRSHTQVPALSSPGTVDVTTDVDFHALRNAISQIEGYGTRVGCYGPVTQGSFLASMGVMERAMDWIDTDSTSDKEANDVVDALDRLCSPEQMGERYKVFCIVKKNPDFPYTSPPPGF